MYWIWLPIFGCSDKSGDSAEVRSWNSAELKPLSSGECPDMSTSGATTDGHHSTLIVSNVR